MSLHDRYARRTPFELTFGDPARADRLRERIDEEVSLRGGSAEDPHAFVTLGSVGAFIRELEGEGTPNASLHHFGALLYHGVHFADAGYPVYLVTAPAARYLVEGAPAGRPVPPRPSGYLQLPQHLFWFGGAEGPAESVDGVYWAASATGVLRALMVAGVRPDRPGFSVVTLPDAPLADAPAWLSAVVRSEGDDFTSALPGADIDRLYAFRAAGEILKFLARFFAYADAVPSALVSVEPAKTSVDVPGPTPSTLPHIRVTLDA